MWEGQEAAVLASGPSMSPAVAERIRTVVKVRVIAVNTTFRLAPWADILYAADPGWWMTYAKEVAQFQGLKASVSSVPAIKDLLQLRIVEGEGYEPAPDALKTGGNSGYQAIHLAAHTGVRRIYVFGIDLHSPGKHWHGSHPTGLKEMDGDAFLRWSPRFAVLAGDLAARGIEVYNCSPGSALACFPRADFETLIGEPGCAQSA